MKYKDKEIKELTDLELVWAKVDLENRLVDLMERRQHPKFKTKMINQPEAPINPAFLQLKQEIEDELTKRQS